MAGRSSALARSAAAPHVDAANRYAADVVKGRIPACKWTRKACERHLRDLDRQGKRGFPYRFSAERAERVCDFAGGLSHFKGPLAGELFILEPWESFFLCSIFGWIDRRTGMRRFRRFYLEVPRGSGKSFLLSIIGIYMLAADGESGAEIYSAATSRDQAKIVFTAAQEIARRSPDLLDALGLEVLAHAITQPGTASVFRALASEDRSLDGLNVHFAAVDELHAHETRAVYDVLETAIGKRAQPLLGVITTAGSDRTGICYEIRNDLTQVLDQAVVDEGFFGVIYTIDEGDDWRDQATWKKANPNLGVSVNLETLTALAKKAERTPAAQAAFKTKHLDVWVGADAALYSLDDWLACADPGLDEAQFVGEKCIAAVDLASVDDLAPLVKIFRRVGGDGREHYYVFSRNHICQKAVDDGRNASYRGWAITGALAVNEGNTIDHGLIEGEILADAARFELLELAVDSYQSTGISQRLIAKGLVVAKLEMNAGTLSEPTKMLEALMKERRIHHTGDQVLAWAIGNVVGHYDVKENVYPRKERRENKIDPAVATIMALSRWRLRTAPAESIYNTRGDADQPANGGASAPMPPASSAEEATPAAAAGLRRRSVYDSDEWTEHAKGLSR
jgi:phage terminase large subunit-like protein